MSNLAPATVEQFGRPETLILGMKVHVLGWAKGAVFKLISTDGVTALIVSPSNQKQYTVHHSRLLNLAGKEKTV